MLPPDSHIRLVRHLGRTSAIWSVGDAFIKIQRAGPDTEENTTEATTLDWLCAHNLSFNVPKVLYRNHEHNLHILFISRVPGETLEQAWKVMGEDEKQDYAKKVAGVCKELSVFTAPAIMGVGGGHLSDTWLDVADTGNFSPEGLRESCGKIGMDCSTFVFSHNDLGPTNILINSGQKGRLGVIDWEMAGYVPSAWVRTKFGVSWGLNFEWPDVQAGSPCLKEWRRRVEQQLGYLGFEEVIASWTAQFP